MLDLSRIKTRFTLGQPFEAILAPAEGEPSVTDYAYRVMGSAILRELCSVLDQLRWQNAEDHKNALSRSDRDAAMKTLVREETLDELAALVAKRIENNQRVAREIAGEILSSTRFHADRLKRMHQ